MDLATHATRHNSSVRSASAKYPFCILFALRSSTKSVLACWHQLLDALASQSRAVPYLRRAYHYRQYRFTIII